MTAREIKIGRTILEGLVSAIVGDIRFNNYDASLRTAEVISQPPLKRNDSWVELLGEKTTFTPEVISLAYTIRGSLSGHEYKSYKYRAFINNISLDSNRPELLLRTGQIGIRIVFNAAVSREVKGFILDDGWYNDEQGRILILPHWRSISGSVPA